jgi:hypothetical protein
MLVFRSCSCGIRPYDRVPRLTSADREGGPTFKQRRSYETSKYQPAQQAQHEHNRLDRDENHHSDLRGIESSLRLT